MMLSSMMGLKSLDFEVSWDLSIMDGLASLDAGFGSAQPARDGQIQKKINS
jgi:hypothetical protein